MLPIPELRARLEDAMDTAQERGIKIVPGASYRNIGTPTEPRIGEACALAAYDHIINHNPRPSFASGAYSLDMIRHGDAFVIGFDYFVSVHLHTPHSSPIRIYKWQQDVLPRIIQEYMLGRRLARKYRRS